jgi:hypothetical protein
VKAGNCLPGSVSTNRAYERLSYIRKVWYDKSKQLAVRRNVSLVAMRSGWFFHDTNFPYRQTKGTTMNLLHAIVQHQTFGRGEVVQQDEEMISISFPKPVGKKRFLYPSSFLQYLTLEDGLLSDEMKNTLAQNNLQFVEEQQRAERSKRIAHFRAISVEKSKVTAKSKKKK